MRRNTFFWPRLSALTLCLLTAAGCGEGVLDESGEAALYDEASGELSAIDTAVYDMYGPKYRTDGLVKNGVLIGGAPWGAHEALPKKLPSNFDFFHGARPGTWAGTQGTGRAVSGWGQLFEAQQGTGTYDVRLQAREFQLYFLMKDGRWVEKRATLDDHLMEGAYWNSYFASQQGASVRDEANNGGGSSVSLKPMVKSNHATFHFWWKGWYPRELIPADAVGVFVSAQLRLLPDAAGVDVSKAKFIASVGADNYSSATYSSQGEAISSVMQPRMKFVTAQWNSFTGTTLTEAQLRANPPPYKATGAVAPPAPTSSPYVEDYSDGQAQGWAHANGSWSVSSGELRQSAVAADVRSSYTYRTWETGYRLRARMLSEYGGSGNQFGLTFNASTAGNRYDLRMSPTGRVTLERVSGSTRTVLASGSAVIGSWRWFDVEVIRAGGSATVKINGATVFSNVVLPGVTAGRIGLFASWNPVRVTRISVE